MRRLKLSIGALAAALALGGAWATAQEGRPQAARVGQAAPAFSLTDLAGATHTLEQYTREGKVVVLEWFNPDCPFVKKHHERNKTMKELAARYRDRGVVWLAINSAAPGKQGHGQERNARAAREYQIEYPVLLDPTGATGHAYGAVCTPHMYVISAEGTLVYAGAIDDDRSPQNLGRTNHVARALDALLEQRAVETGETRPYG